MKDLHTLPETGRVIQLRILRLVFCHMDALLIGTQHRIIQSVPGFLGDGVKYVTVLGLAVLLILGIGHGDEQTLLGMAFTLVPS